MSQNIGCFENIIGISRTTCQCKPTMPAGYNISESGLFMDELEGMYLDMIQAAKDCDKGNLWDMMNLAREEAIGALKTELRACITSNTEPQRPYFTGTLGDPPSTANESQTGKTFAGQAWNLINARGATLRIKRIGAAFNATSVGSIILNIHDDLDAAPLYSIPLNTTANALNWNTTSGIEIPLSIVERPFKTLYFTYTVNPAINPKEMKVSCGCGNLGTVNLWHWTNPLWRMVPEPNTRYDWLNYLQVTGINTNAVSLDSSVNFSTYQLLSGLLFDVEITCDIANIICNETFASVDPTISLVMAHAVRYKANSILLTNILSTPNLSRYTTRDKQYNEDKRLEFIGEYDQRINGFLCPTLSKYPYLNKYNDCLKCRDKFPVTRGRILK